MEGGVSALVKIWNFKTRQNKAKMLAGIHIHNSDK